jgi:hypothetical protein
LIEKGYKEKEQLKKASSKDWSKNRKYDINIVNQIIDLSKKYILESKLKFIDTNKLKKYLFKFIKDEKVIGDNIYGYNGALNIMIKNKILSKDEIKLGKYNVM